MKKNSQNNTNPGESTSTQFKESRTFGKLLETSNSSKVEEAKVENFDWVPLKNGPFYAVGKTGAYTLVLCGQAVSGKKFKSIAKAQEEVDKKGWDLIFVATAVYRDAWEAANRKK